MKMTTETRDGRITWVTLSGSFDLEAARGIDEKFHAETADRRRPVVVDLAGVDVIVSLAIGMLLACATSLRRRDLPMVLLDPRPPVESILVKCRVDHVVSIAHGEAAALEIIQAAAME